MLHFLDIAFTIVHLALTGFNLLGWIWRRTRRAHFITIIVTGLCWSLLGIWYGIGYCPITDWQWEVKERLGETNLPDSFIKYFADKITGQNFDPSLVNNVTLGLFLAAVLLSVYFNFFRKKNKSI